MAKDTVEEIKQKLSIQDVVAPYVKLKRAGKSLTGLCPFHKEKSPSFHVSSQRGTFHCFGCGAGGDMFSFIEKIEGVDFKGALKMLAEKAGVQLVFQSGGNHEEHKKKDRLYDALQKAEKFFVSQLTDGSDAYQYALSRGMTKETLQDWGIGYAPDGWRMLLDALTVDGFKTNELLEAGLIKEADGKPGTYYDRFRNRLMFPIRDVAGRTVGFSGRALPAKAGSAIPAPGTEPAKYLNSPETEVFNKSSVLFGIDRAKDSIRTRGFAILVEGQMDLIHAHQAGFTNAIALSGTALTRNHTSLVRRYAENLMLALDADKAGLAASARSAELAARENMHVKAIRMPEGKDPADVISEDAKVFTDLVASAAPAVEFFLAVLAEQEKDQHRLVLSIERTVLPLLAALQSPLERQHFVAVVARFLGVSSETVRDALARHMTKNPVSYEREGSVEAPQAGPSALAPAASGARETFDLLLRAILRAYPDTPLAKAIETGYIRIIGSPASTDEVPDRAIFEAGIMFGEEPAETSADGLLRRFERAVLDEAYAEILARLRRHQETGNQAGIEEAEAECAALTKRIALLS